MPSVIASCKYPLRYDNIKPDTIVAKAAHLNQKRAEGAITLLIAGFVHQYFSHIRNLNKIEVPQ